MVEEARTRPVHTSEYSEWRRASTKELKAGGSRSRLLRRAVGGRERGCWQAACGLQTVSRQARRPLPTDRGGRLLRIFSDASCGGLHCAWQALWSEDLGEHRGPAWKASCGVVLHSSAANNKQNHKKREPEEDDAAATAVSAPDDDDDDGRQYDAASATAADDDTGGGK